MIGDSVNAALAIGDYRPLQQAYSDKADRTAKAIDQASSNWGDYLKGQREEKKMIKQGEEYAKSAMLVFPEMKPQMEQVLAELQDERIPFDDRLAKAQSIENILQMNFQGQRMQMGREQMDLERMRTVADVNRSNLGNDMAMQEFQTVQEDRDAAGEIADIKAAQLINWIDSNPKQSEVIGVTPETLSRLVELPGPSRLKAVESMIAMLPERAQVQIIKDAKWNVGGQNFEGVAAYDPMSNTLNPVPVGGVDIPPPDAGVAVDGGAGVLPPLQGAQPQPAPGNVLDNGTTAMQEKIAAHQEARKAYESGDKNKALAILNSVGGKGLLGGLMGMNDLEMYFGGKPTDNVDGVTPPAPTSLPPRNPGETVEQYMERLKAAGLVR